MLGELAGDLFQLRRQAKVQREGDALVLQMQAGVLAAGFGQLALDALQLPGIQRQVAQLAFGIPALGAMPRGGRLQRRQQRIELGQGRPEITATGIPSACSRSRAARVGGGMKTSSGRGCISASVPSTSKKRSAEPQAQVGRFDRSCR